MITTVRKGGKKMLAIILPGISTINDARELRDALADVLETCLSSDEGKDMTSSVSMWFVLQTIRGLTADLEKEAREQLKKTINNK